jgi:protein kinase-like protein
MDKRDQVVANIALNLGVIDHARLQQAVQLRGKHPKMPFERLLTEARLIDAEGYQRLAAAFNQVLNQARAEAAQAQARGQAAAQPYPAGAPQAQQPPSGGLQIPDEDDGVFDEPTMVVPDDEGDEEDVFDQPTMVVADEGPAPGVPILDVASDDNVFDEPTMVVPDDGSYGDDQLTIPDELDVFDQQTMVVPDEDEDLDVFDQQTMVVPDDSGEGEVDVFDQQTLVVPEESDVGLAIPMDEDEILAQPTMIVPDELEPAPTAKRSKPGELRMPSDPSLRLASSGRARPKGKSVQAPGPLDREEFQRRLKLRLGFEKCSLGDYEVHGEIARGAFGVVLEVEAVGVTGNLAKQRGYAGRMALKVALENKTDPRETERFLHETRVQIRFDHPHIVRIFDCGVEQGLTYYSMELIQGIESRAHVLRHGPMPPLLAARIAMETADALAYVHGQRIYHRDLKPHNIMIDQSQKPFRAVLIDFGLVVESESGKDKGLIVGTPSYMPPEQAQPRGGHGPINITTDIYSLGATLFFLLTGRAPFTGRDPRKIIKQLVVNPPPDPLALNPNIPKGLAEITLKCLEKKQADRYHSAKLLAADLEKEIKSGKMKLKAKSFLGRFGLGGKKK